MGVVYKTKPEVIDFILEQKKKEPILSCRSLVNIIEKRFNLALSKSAINKIIKEAGLSSSVGRKRKQPSQTPIQPAEPQIKIQPPVEKEIEKEEILLIEGRQTPELLEKIEEKTEQRKEEIKEEKIPALELPTEPKIIPEAPKERFEVKFEHIEIRDDEAYDCLGSFFLKAAGFELADTLIFTNLLDINQPKELFKELGFIGDILLFLPIFDIKDLSQLSSDKAKGLWVLTGQRRPAQELISQYINRLENIRGLSLQLHTKRTQLFQEVSFLKIFLEDDTVFYIDARFKSMWQQPPSSDCFSTSYHKVKHYINNLFIENSQAIILFTAIGFDSFSKVVSEFIFACEGIADKRIIKIGLFDNEQSEKHKFLSIPQVKRHFVFSFWPWMKESMELSKKEGRALSSFYSEELRRDIYYQEGQMELIQHLVDERVILRFALLKDSPATPVRMGILTNISVQEDSMEEIIRLYLERWPNLEEAYQDFLKRSQKLSFLGLRAMPSQPGPCLESNYYNLSDSAVSIWKELNYILSELSRYTQRHFFPPEYRDADFETMKQRFYSLPGRLKKSRNRFVITLLVPQDYGFYKDLLYAIKRINESEIQDSSQEKVLFDPPQKALP